LEQLGGRCPPESEIVLAGGAALILGGYIERGTSDGDVIDADPRFNEIADVVAAVADERRLPATWLNDGARGFLDVLPPDYRERLEEAATFGNLRVLRLGRLDPIGMKSSRSARRTWKISRRWLHARTRSSSCADSWGGSRGRGRTRRSGCSCYLEQGASLHARSDAPDDDPERGENP